MTRHFLIIGAQRCGTTFLHSLLDAHPYIAMARPSHPEPKVFLSDRSIAVGLAGAGPDYSTWHADLLPSGQWGPLQPFDSSVGLRQLDFALDIDLRTHAFGIDPNGAVWHKSQTTPGTWPPP